MPDPFYRDNKGIDAPASVAKEIYPENFDTDLTAFPRAISVREAGDVVIHDLKGNETTLFLNAGIMFPQRIRRIVAAGTTASGIIGHY